MYALVDGAIIWDNGTSVSSMKSSGMPLTDALIAKSSWDSLKATMLPFFFR
jgi:hypothetical protein